MSQHHGQYPGLQPEKAQQSLLQIAHSTFKEKTCCIVLQAKRERAYVYSLAATVLAAATAVRRHLASLYS